MKRFIISLLAVFVVASGVSAQEPEPFKVYLPMILSNSPGIGGYNPDNNWRIIQPVYSKNQVLNPSAEIAGNFAALGGATATRVTTYQKYGLYSYRVQTAADNDGISLTLGTLDNANHYVTLWVRGTLPASWDWSLDNSTYHIPVNIQKIDQNWNLYGFHIQASEASGSTTLYIRQNGAGSGDFYLDGIQVEALDYWTTYIDGTQDGCAWLGAANGSASERSALSRAGGEEVDLYERYNFQVLKVTGAAAVSHTLGIDSYAILPGGELNSDKVTHRQFVIMGKFIALSESDLLTKKAELEAAFYTTDSQLTRLRFNGGPIQKEIAVRYQSGLEGDLSTFYGCIEIMEDEQYTEHALYTEKAAVQVVAPDPYWYEIGESAAVLDTNDSATFRAVAGRLRSTGQWDELGPSSSTGNGVLALAEDSTYIYIGGDFTNWNGDANSDYIVRYNKQTGIYSSLGTGANQIVKVLLILPNGNLVAGGSFTSIGGTAASKIAEWSVTGSTWGAYGAGADGDVNALRLLPDGSLVVGGAFVNAGGASANRIANWSYSGSTWSTYGSGMDAAVQSIIIYNNQFVAGGSFSTANGVTVNGVATWNGSTFDDFAGGISAGTVNSLALQVNNLLLAAGTFTTIGGVSANRIAAWNGDSWVNLGDGVNNTASRMAVGVDGSVIVSGSFTSAGGISVADRVARWNGYAWGHLDIDLPGSPTVSAIIASRYSDPVILQQYDIYFGYNTTGTGNFAGLATVTNDGKVQAFPKVVYARSGGTTATIETLRNETTGKELLLNYSLLDNEVLTIDLDQTARSITSNFLGSQPSAVLANSDFGTWALLPGDNDVTSFVATSGSPTIVGYLLWREGYSSY